jgi:hypothetical protein
MAITERPAPAHTAQMRTWVDLGGGNSGIIGNKAHKAGGHRGAAFIPASDYTRRRDPNGSDGPYTDWGHCVSGDYHHGGKAALRARHAVLLTRLMDGDPELSNVWEFIGQPWADKPVYYWQLANGRRTLQRYTGKGHDLWSHITVWRSASAAVPNLWLPASAAVKPAPGKMVPVARTTTTPKAPAWPRGKVIRPSNRAKYDPGVRAWQARMRQRGWKIKADGYYGPASAEIARAFQREKRLGVDGLLGPVTFAAAWSAKVTK